SAAALVDPDRGAPVVGLTPGALALDALVERVVQQPFPKTARPFGVVRGKLDQRQPRAGHAPKPTAPLRQAGSMTESTSDEACSGPKSSSTSTGRGFLAVSGSSPVPGFRT